MEEGIQFFSSVQKIKRALEALHDTGLDYLKLGQQSPTLSGGEAQRVKLVTHLLTGLKPGLDLPQLANRPANIAKKNLFILEEPTIGLHMQDVRRLVEVVQRLVDADVPFKVIGDYVGHQRADSTQVYGKVAIHLLRQLALGDGEEAL